jgi:methyltransferase (TIGR00027 family)
MSKISTKNIGGVPETLLPVLYARAVESRRPDGIISDPVAENWVSRIDYDFSQYDASHANNLGIAIRTEILDEYCRAFITKHPNATIINVGAGLDTRWFRMDNGHITWIEVDLPETIALREQVVETHERYHLWSADALNTTWMERLKTMYTPEDGLLFIVEGLIMYFTEAQNQSLLRAWAERFPSAEMLLEVMGRSQAQRTERNDAISKTSASFVWGLRDVTTLADWHPQLVYLSDISLYDRYEARWLALDLKWPVAPSQLRNTVDRIVHLRISPHQT